VILILIQAVIIHNLSFLALKLRKNFEVKDGGREQTIFFGVGLRGELLDWSLGKVRYFSPGKNIRLLNCSFQWCIMIKYKWESISCTTFLSLHLGLDPFLGLISTSSDDKNEFPPDHSCNRFSC